jgi:hypothetical protein
MYIITGNPLTYLSSLFKKGRGKDIDKKLLILKLQKTGLKSVLLLLLLTFFVKGMKRKEKKRLLYV